MPRSLPPFVLAAAALAAGPAPVCHAQTASAAPIDAKVLLQATHAWDGTPYRAYPSTRPEVSVVRYTLPAHAVLPWHTHPSINVGYVVSGHLSAVRKQDGKRISLGPGDVVPEMVDVSHRGETGSEPVEMIVFYAGTPGTPLTVPDSDD